MKLKWRSLAISLGFVGVLRSITPVEARETRFICGSWRNIPMTVAQTHRGNIPVIYWVSDWVNDPNSELTPKSRCKIVSNNFQQAFDRGDLQYITTGYKNGQNIVCVAQYNGGPCHAQLFTLKPDSDPSASLRQLMNIGENYASGAGGPLEQASGQRIYVNFDAFLEQAANSALEHPNN